MSSQPRREHLLNIAYRLFNQHGYHATGIDLILAESGVSKATLYKYFSCKEALILEVLQRRHTQLEQHFKQALQEAKNTKYPALCLFDVLTNWFNEKEFFGCNFIKASGEFPDRKSEIHRYAAWHKESVKQLIADSFKSFGKRKQVQLADAIVLLMDGAIVTAQVKADKSAAQTSKKIAEAMINGSL